MTGEQVRRLAAKEVRALLPLWMTCGAVVALSPFMRGAIHEVSGVAIVVGTLALGAYSVGHEYMHRTVGVMLTLPADRRRIFIVKLAVIVALVLPLVGLVSWLRLYPDVRELPLLIGAGTVRLVPAVTMRCRNPIAGVMFSIWGPAMLLLGIVVALFRLGSPEADIERAAFTIWGRIMLVVFAAAAVAAWRSFRTLEWNEHGVEISLPWRYARARQTATRHPLSLLVRKELRLQRLAFSMAAFYVVASFVEEVTRRFWPHDLPFLVPVTQGYWFCLPVLIGSLASAEERQLGTLSWQLLLPLRAWQQWAVKACVVLGLGLLLGIGIPLVVLSLEGSGLPLAWPDATNAIIQTAALSALGLYTSSLCRSGVMAGAISFAVMAALMWLAGVVGYPPVRPGLYQPFGFASQPPVSLLVLAAASILLVRLGLENHSKDGAEL